MAGRLPNTRRIRVVTSRRGAVGEEKSLEAKDGGEGYERAWTRSGEIQWAVRKGEITVLGGPI